MKNKINIYIKKLSFITAQPDSDWLRVFIILILLAAFSLGWNIYFYFSVKHDIENVVSNSVVKPSALGPSTEEEMRDIIKKYDSRAAESQAAAAGSSPEVADPA